MEHAGIEARSFIKTLQFFHTFHKMEIVKKVILTQKERVIFQNISVTNVVQILCFLNGWLVIITVWK